MTTLVIPDVHTKWQLAEHIRTTVPYDRCVFLGDVFDDFNDTIEITRDTAEWYKRMLTAPTTLMLLGNHDAQYLWPHIRGLRCSGFSDAKALIIKEVFDNNFQVAYDNLHLYTIADKWLLSHAGWDRAWLKQGLRSLENHLDHMVNQVWAGLEAGIMPYLLNAGPERGGYATVGGPTWVDWSTLEITPGVNQITGHTFRREVRTKRYNTTSMNYCIDTGLRNYALIEDGVVTICNSPFSNGTCSICQREEFQDSPHNHACE